MRLNFINKIDIKQNIPYVPIAVYITGNANTYYLHKCATRICAYRLFVVCVVYRGMRDGWRKSPYSMVSSWASVRKFSWLATVA